MDIEIDSLKLPEFGLTHKAGNYADLAYRSLSTEYSVDELLFKDVEINILLAGIAKS